jgi:hypothetical protein
VSIDATSTVGIAQKNSVQHGVLLGVGIGGVSAEKSLQHGVLSERLAPYAVEPGPWGPEPAEGG